MGFFDKLKNWFTSKVLRKEKEEIPQMKVSDDFDKGEQYRKEETKIVDKIAVPKKEEFKVESVKRETEPFRPKKEKESISDLNRRITPSEEIKERYELDNALDSDRKLYKRIFERSTINIKTPDGEFDENLFQILLENRRKLQNRFTAEIKISTDKGNATMELFGVVPDDLKDITSKGFVTINWRYGSQELKEVMYRIISHYKKQHGVIDGTVTNTPEGTVKVTGISTDVTFK